MGDILRRICKMHRLEILLIQIMKRFGVFYTSGRRRAEEEIRIN